MKTAFPPIAGPESRILILGTMPGDRSLKLQQYYGHSGNHFWKMMFLLFDKTFTPDYETRKQLLLDHGIALWDVLQACECEGSSDNNIKNEVANNFSAFYTAHPYIKTIFFASKKAEAFYDKYVIKDPAKTYDTLPSPSSANTWKTFDQKLEEWKKIL
ncbi:DNA-deoxyinosine glycosylase [Pedobacter metabolipauper]|uniref:G/U mismatch-specific uracil-DNA glycosylase n=1 Tax=Pedobacter metabolipauper TaxID=425513 RepID=A0A4R6SUF5_9SPHI|nr:DNA-deoxyinosine glycosylase [Pedobacter metabolipauper]TDQ08410.1 G/U mismatch-specific uracil-DNA glycosylase [Pedobacter metabolipauper]